MSRPSEYSLKLLWFMVPDLQGRSRTGAICGVSWKGDWPLSESLLPAGMDESLQRYSHAGRRSQSMLGRFALSELKGRAGPVAAEMSFSISHSGRTAVALGFEDDECGIDLELGADQAHSIRVTRKFVSEHEVRRLEEERLSPWALWCAKESLGKALGTGLKAPLHQYELRSLDLGVMAFGRFPGYRAVAWDLRRGGEQSAHLAICLPGCDGDAASSALRRIAVRDWFSGL